MRSFVPGLIRVDAGGAATLPLLVVVLSVSMWPGGGSAQVVSGVVQDRANGSPIAGASVAQVREGEALASTTTDVSGRFELALREGGSSELHIARIGYRPHVVSLQPDTVSSEPVVIELASDPFLVSGIDIDVEREPEQFRHSSLFRWTEDGLYYNTAMHEGCYLLVLDGVVIRNPDLYRAEVLEGYWPASQFMDTDHGLRVAARSGALLHSQPDPERLEREADPCQVAVFIPGKNLYHGARSSVGVPPENYPERPPPEPDAPAFELVPSVEVALGAGGPVQGELAEIPAVVGPGGILAVADPAEATLRVLGPDGREIAAWMLNVPPASLQTITHLGWSADTLWAAGRRRVVHLPPGATTPLVREPRAPQLVAGDVEGAPYERGGADLELPLPLGEHRWLSVQPAGPEPYPVRMKDEPARRALVVLDAEQRVERVIAMLRPGPWRVDVKEPHAPVDPFRDHPLYAVDPDGGHLTVVDRSLQHAVWMNIYTVTRLTPDGDTLFRVERPPPLIRPSAESRGAAAAELAEHPVLAEALPLDEARPFLLAALLYKAPFHPPISDLVVGRDGTTWLRWPDVHDGPVRWDVLDPEGMPLRTLFLDRRMRIVGATADSAWGLVAGGDGLRATHFEIERRR